MNLAYGVSPSAVDITTMLMAWQQGDDQAANGFMPALYDDLRKMAAGRLRREPAHVSISATELVNEAMLRLFGAQGRSAGEESDTHEAERKLYQSRSHFLAVSALYMRSILVDRARSAISSGEPADMATLTVALALPVSGDIGALQLIALDQALQRLKTEDLRACRVVELATFSGMQREEIAAVMALSIPTVDRDLRFARAFLNDALA